MLLVVFIELEDDITQVVAADDVAIDVIMVVVVDVVGVLVIDEMYLFCALLAARLFVLASCIGDVLGVGS